MGKFEGEPRFVPYFWESGLDGCSDEDYTDETGAVYAFDVDDRDKKLFPELSEIKRIELREDEQGFVRCKVI